MPAPQLPGRRLAFSRCPAGLLALASSLKAPSRGRVPNGFAFSSAITVMAVARESHPLPSVLPYSIHFIKVYHSGPRYATQIPLFPRRL